MIFQEGLERAQHYYNSRNYEQAIDFLYSLNEKTTEPKQKALLDLWLGKCFYEQQEVVIQTHSYTYIALEDRKSRMHPQVPAYISKNNLKLALSYFNRAIHQDPLLSSAYYEKGILKAHQNKFDAAYKCFVLAANHSKDLNEKKKYRYKCINMFAEHQTLPFMETRPLSTMQLESALITASSSVSPYLRIEACQYILQFASFDSQISDQIRQVISPLAGYNLLCSYVPFTGDSDNRVRQIARKILSKLS